MSFSQIDVTSFDHTTLKASLVEFMKSTGEFSDFDYDGSAINTIIDLLVRNAEYDAFLATMQANESFLDTAQIRANVSSHAQKLSYLPKSTTSAVIEIDLNIIPVVTESIPSQIIIDAGTEFFTNFENETYTFVTKDDYIAYINVDGDTYTARGVKAYQGHTITNKFSYDGNSITIPNKSCDTSTLNVVVKDNVGSDGVRYTLAEDLADFGASSSLYFLSENRSAYYYIEFGGDIFGNEPAIGSIIEISYISTEAVHANDVGTVTPGSSIQGYSNIVATVVTKSYGGSDRDDIERIRFIAPRAFQTQDRAVNNDDYVNLVYKYFPYVKSAVSWGGEFNIPPQYGSVFISVILDNDRLLTQSLKDVIALRLADKNIGSITPLVVNPEVFKINLDVKFSYSSKLTTQTFDQLQVDIVNVCTAYNESNINDFNEYFNHSLLVNKIQNIAGVESVYLNSSLYKDVTIQIFDNPIYEIFFKNAVEPGSLLSDETVVLSIGATEQKIYDEDGIVYGSYKNENGEVIVLSLGEIDYDTGYVNFTANMLQGDDVFKLYVKTLNDNIYSTNTQILQLDEIKTGLLT